MKPKLFFLLLLSAKLFGQEAITHFDFKVRDIVSPQAYVGEIEASAVYKAFQNDALLLTKEGVTRVPALPGQINMFTFEKALYRIAQREEGMHISKWKGEDLTVRDANYLMNFGANIYYQKEGHLWRKSVVDGHEERLLQGAFEVLKAGNSAHKYLHGESGLVLPDGQVLQRQIPDIRSLVLHQNGVLVVAGPDSRQYWIENNALREVGTGGYDKYYSRGQYMVEMRQGTDAEIKVSTLGTEGKMVLLDTAIKTQTLLITFALSHSYVPYEEPQLIGDYLLFIGSVSLQGYYSDVSEKELSLYQINIHTGEVEKLNVDMLIPGGSYYPLAPFRTEVVEGGKLRIFSSKDALNVYDYDPEQRAFTSRLRTPAERANTHLAFGGTRISLDKEKWILWDTAGEESQSIPYPVDFLNGKAVERMSASQGKIWISHRVDNAKVSIARYDGSKLHSFGVQVGSSVPLNIRHGQGEDGSMVLLENSNFVHAFLEQGDSLMHVGSGQITNGSSSEFTFRRVGQALEVMKANAQRLLIYKGKIIQTEAVFKDGHVHKQEHYLVYSTLDGKGHTRLSNDFFSLFITNNRLYWVDSKGYHSFDGGVLSTREEMRGVALIPRITPVGSKYIVVQVNEKVFLMDVETGTETLTGLPVEAAVGNWYFQEDDYIYGVSVGTFRIYRYSLSQKRLEELKKFTGSTRLGGDKRIWVSQGQRTEIWEVIQGKLQRRMEFSSAYSPAKDVPQVTSLGLYIDPQQRKVSYSLIESPADWIDSVKTVQFFSSQGKLWAWDGNSLDHENLGEFNGEFLREGNAVYYVSGDELFKRKGLETRRISKNSPKSLMFIDAYLYWIAEGQIWRMKDTDIEGEDKIPTYSVYPNPTQERLYINSLVHEGKILRMVVFDQNGRVVLEKFGTRREGLDVSKLQAGLYFIQIEGQTSRFVKAL